MEIAKALILFVVASILLLAVFSFLDALQIYCVLIGVIALAGGVIGMATTRSINEVRKVILHLLGTALLVAWGLAIAVSSVFFDGIVSRQAGPHFGQPEYVLLVTTHDRSYQRVRTSHSQYFRIADGANLRLSADANESSEISWYSALPLFGGALSDVFCWGFNFGPVTTRPGVPDFAAVHTFEADSLAAALDIEWFDTLPLGLVNERSRRLGYSFRGSTWRKWTFLTFTSDIGDVTFKVQLIRIGFDEENIWLLTRGESGHVYATQIGRVGE